MQREAFCTVSVVMGSLQNELKMLQKNRGSGAARGPEDAVAPGSKL